MTKTRAELLPCPHCGLLSYHWNARANKKDEFLEELQEFVKQKWIKHGGEYLDILKKIEQFRAEVNNENK